MLADCVVIFAFRMMEKGMKAEKELRRQEAEKEKNQQHEQDKANTKAMKKQERDAQKREQSRINRPPKGQSAFASSFTIQQPKKGN